MISISTFSITAMIACIFEHIQRRSAHNDFIAHGYMAAAPPPCAHPVVGSVDLRPATEHVERGDVLGQKQARPGPGVITQQ
jgi:hypothetical protein